MSKPYLVYVVLHLSFVCRMFNFSHTNICKQHDVVIEVDSSTAQLWCLATNVV